MELWLKLFFKNGKEIKIMQKDLKQELKLQLENPELRIITGSRLYGTYRTNEIGEITSDVDLRDVVIPSKKYLSVVHGDFAQLTGKESDDHLVYSINFFTKQLIGSNPQFLEMLFAPSENLLKISDIGQQIVNMRDKLVSKQFYNRISGFANSEFRKACGEKLVFEEPEATEKSVWDRFLNVFGPLWGEDRKEIADQIKALTFSYIKPNIIPSTDGISKKRREEFTLYGYCSSSACHSLRLMRQATELMKTGFITFPRPDAVELRDIKMGKSSKEAFIKLYNDASKEAKDALDNSTLQLKCDEEYVTNWLENIILESMEKV